MQTYVDKQNWEKLIAIDFHISVTKCERKYTALVRCKKSGRTAPPEKNVKKCTPRSTNIALFLYCRTMTVAPCLHLNFRTKVE